MAVIVIEKMTFEDGVYGDIIDIDISGESLYVVYRQLILVLADGSDFSVGTPISGDSDNGNDGVGVVRQKIDVDTVVVDLTSGTFVASNGVDDVAVYVGDNTTITSVTQSIKALRKNISADEQLGTYI